MGIKDIIETFPGITLKEMKTVKLLNRIDTKFVTTTDKLVQFLQLAKDDYYVQDREGLRLMPYHTIYLDTPELDMYHDHQRGKKHRFKVRMRKYEGSGDAFLEVKNKSNKGRTKKKRTELTELVYETQEQMDYISTLVPYESENLSPVIENRFHRITLVNKGKTERLTIDIDLWFHNMRNDAEHSLPQHTVIELKREGLVWSPAIALLRDLRIKPLGFSKMALGMAYTDPTLKQNLFKQRLRMIEKL